MAKERAPLKRKPKPPEVESIPATPKFKSGELRVTDISQHFTKLSPKGLKQLERVLDKNSVVLQTYRDALQVREAIEKDNNRIRNFDQNFLKRQHDNPFVGLIGPEAYNTVRNALDYKERESKVEQTIDKWRKFVPPGMKASSWQENVDSLERKLRKTINNK